MSSIPPTLSKRATLLKSLLVLDRDVSDTVCELNRLGWDSETELVTLDRHYIVSILDRYLNRQLSASDVEDWANAIESREDIAYEPKFEDAIDRAIQALANPVLTRSLSERTAKEWIQFLQHCGI